ncbi:hypothetical protein [Phaffia rhodozyma]|uniref:Uncharacterized protein n=1 Tax=Phaffia rhodozyma TaxID=264483 RepID=A0A0F7SUN8_PHARH|nr:hypothetical protein [Phaffia rhodozyma]
MELVASSGTSSGGGETAGTETETRTGTETKKDGGWAEREIWKIRFGRCVEQEPAPLD